MDITKCTGAECPMKDKCFRYLSKAEEYQSWFMYPPGAYLKENNTIVFKCKMFWHNDIGDLNQIINGKTS